MNTPCGCEDNQITITNCTEPVPTPPECTNGEKCTEITDAHCVQYTGEDIESLGIDKNDRLDEILNKLSVNLETQAIDIEDTNSINLSGSGLSSDKLKADVKISTSYEKGINTLKILSDGLYSPKGLPLTKGSDTTISKKVGGVRINITSNNVTRQPVFDIEISNLGVISAVNVIDGGLFTGTPVGQIVSEFGSGAILNLVTSGTTPNITITSVTVTNGGTGYKNDHYFEVDVKLSQEANNQLRVLPDGLYADSSYAVLNSADDNVPDYLENKIQAGSNITIDKETNESGYETLVISAAPDVIQSVDNTETIELNITSNELKADLILDEKFLVTPSINPGFTYKQNDGVTNYLSNISQGLGYNDTDPKNIIVDTGAVVNINGNYVWNIVDGDVDKAPSNHSGDFATGVLPANGVNSTPNFTQNITSNIRTLVTKNVIISANKTGLEVLNNKVVKASGIESKSASISIKFRDKFYAGISTSSSLVNSATIKNLSLRGFIQDDSKVELENIETTSTQYLFFCYPANYPLLKNVIKNNSLPILGAFVNLGNITVLNDAGLNVSYRVYRTNAINPFSDISLLNFEF